jgi:hypothetical protein
MIRDGRTTLADLRIGYSDLARGAGRRLHRDAITCPNA